jgi:hypothetical protein
MSNKLVVVLTTAVEIVVKSSIQSLEYLKDSLSADHSELLSSD